MITATISTYNREKYLPQVLDSLKRQTLSPEYFEIVIVNNNSPGNTREISEQFIAENPQLKVFYHLETQQGLSYGRNRGIHESRGKYISFIDDDAFLKEDFLERVYHYFETDQTIAAIGGKILLHYESNKPNWGNKYLNTLFGFFDPGDTSMDFKKTNYPRGSNMSFRKDVFDRVGEFNVDLGRKGAGMAGSEEKDIFMRIYGASLFRVVYRPDVIVYHSVPASRTTKKFVKQQAYGTGQGERIRVKNEGGLAPLKRWTQELYKWVGSLALFVIYTLQGRMAAGIMIIKFRYWVSLGLSGRNKQHI